MRGALPVFAATLYATVAFPVPVAPTPTVIQLSLLTAVQRHAAPATTDIAPLAPIDAVSVEEVGEIADTHDAPA